MKTRSFAYQFLLSLILAIGVCGVCLIVGGSIIEALPLPGGDSVHGDIIGVSEDGTPLLLRHLADSGQFEYRDLQGNPVTRPQETHWLRQAALPLNWPTLDQGEWPRLSDGLAPAAYWYWMEDEQRSPARGYFVGYDSKSKKCIGYLGLAGFREDAPPREEMFPGIRRTTNGRFVFLYDPSGEVVSAPTVAFAGYRRTTLNEVTKVFIPTEDGRVFSVNLQKRSVSIIHEGAPILALAHFRDPVNEDAPHRRLAIRKAETVVVIDSTGKLLHQFPIPKEIMEDHFGIAVTEKGEAIIDWTSPNDSLASTRQVRLFRVNGNGLISETPAEVATIAIARRGQVYGGIAYPSPALIASIISLQRVPELVPGRLAAGYGEAVGRALREYSSTLFVSVLISTIFALLGYRRASRYGLSHFERSIWVLFVFGLGLPGWIGFRFGRTWPVLETCPSCEEQIPGNRDVCARCGEKFHAPAGLGTEVFA